MLSEMASNSLHSRHPLARGLWVAGTKDVYPIVSSSHLVELDFKPSALHMLGKSPTTDLYPQPPDPISTFLSLLDLFVYFMYVYGYLVFMYVCAPEDGMGSHRATVMMVVSHHVRGGY